MLASTTLSICSLLSLLACRISASQFTRPSQVTVRAATSYLDYFNIISLKHEVVPAGCPPNYDYFRSSIIRMVDDPLTRNYMAYRGDKLVGCADLITVDVGKHYHIQNVVVHPTNRRCGVASSLLSAASDYVALEKNSQLYSQTQTVLELDVDRSNSIAKSLYMKCGYSPKFSWINLLNHRQRMFKIVGSEQFEKVVLSRDTYTPKLELNWILASSGI